MFKRILVAIDTSTTSQLVFQSALSLAKQTGARLLLLHVLSPDSPDYAPAPSMFVPYYYPVISDTVMSQYQERWQTAERNGLEMLRSMANQATTAGVEVEFSQNLGNPSRLICQFAQDWQANLILLGRRGHSGFNELLLGSVSNYVMHHAPCSVLVAQGNLTDHLSDHLEDLSQTSHSSKTMAV